jgi:hypothetical protein
MSQKVPQFVIPRQFFAEESRDFSLALEMTEQIEVLS